MVFEAHCMSFTYRTLIIQLSIKTVFHSMAPLIMTL